ncbi:uncharacterized protein RBU33_024416 isoform 2-T3 [Hipposideros larvatus]
MLSEASQKGNCSFNRDFIYDDYTTMIPDVDNTSESPDQETEGPPSEGFPPRPTFDDENQDDGLWQRPPPPADHHYHPPPPPPGNQQGPPTPGDHHLHPPQSPPGNRQGPPLSGDHHHHFPPQGVRPPKPPQGQPAK